MLYSFEVFWLDTARRELRRGRVLFALQRQVFDLLDPGVPTSYRLLAQAAGEET